MSTIERWNDTEFGVRLRDGRRLACAMLGDPEGPPVLWFHGTPGSRKAVLPKAAHEGALRILRVERPGYGRSTAKENQTFLEHVGDVRQLLDALELSRVTMAGASGGCAFLAACAYAISDRLRRVVMISPAAPTDDPAVRAGMSLARRRLFALARHFPRFLAWSLDTRFKGDPARVFREVTRGACPADLQVIERHWDELVEMAAEAIRQGGRAFAWEMHRIARPWGFPLEDIRAEVHIVQGLEDHHTPRANGKRLAERIPGATLHEVEGAGHWLYMDHWDKIATLLSEQSSGAKAR